MEKEFIPYEQALALKELGFREHCAAFYSTEEELCFKWESNGNMSLHLLRLIQAPTFSQAFRWFREEYGLPSWNYESEGKWFWKIVKGDFWEQDRKPYTYEEAEIECLKKLIEIVKK